MKRRSHKSPARPAARAPRRAPPTRAGMIVSRRMEFGELEDAVADVEQVLVGEGLMLAPMTVDGRAIERQAGLPHQSVTVLPTAGVRDIETGSLACVIVPGSLEGRSAEGETAFDKLLNTARAEDVPVLAFGGGVGDSLAAVGYEPPADPPPALFIHNGMRILETTDEVRDAIRCMREGHLARKAA